VKAVIISPARLREPSLIERFDYYAVLLRRRIPIEHRLVKKGALLPHVPPGYRTVALDERGASWTSMALADRVGDWERSVAGVAFLIGEADGHEASDLSGAHERWSLSPLTLPHQLCFVIVAEQLYRASAIRRGEPYHRE
jgi:23S rRNA (pseudouridine1915-N3)-methyltransferase